MDVQHRGCRVGILLLSATAACAQHVNSDYGRYIEFGRYKTYCRKDVRTEDTRCVDRIEAAVNSALQASGWTEVESGRDPSVMPIETTALLTPITAASAEAAAGMRQAGSLTNSELHGHPCVDPHEALARPQISGPHSTWSDVPQVTQPTLTAGRIKSGVRLAEAERDHALMRYEKVIQTAFTEVSEH